MDYSKEEKKEAEEQLRALIPTENRIIYTIVKKVSSSGMYRHISAYIIAENEPRCIDWAVSRLLDLSLKKDGLGVSGCGMDMGFHIVYNLGRVLYPNGDGITITGRNGSKEPETDGGYLITQKWL